MCFINNIYYYHMFLLANIDCNTNDGQNDGHVPCSNMARENEKFLKS